MAFSNNQSYQQSPPNIRNKMMHPQGGYSLQHQMQSTHHKLNTLFDKNKTSNLNLGAQTGPHKQGGPNGLFQQNLQTINVGSNAHASLLLPHAPGAVGGG
jgi:hypothetical protein